MQTSDAKEDIEEGFYSITIMLRLNEFFSKQTFGYSIIISLRFNYIFFKYFFFCINNKHVS
jgi:hypothetical protein